jgi:surface protein
MIFKVAFAVLASALISGKDNGHAFEADLGNKKGSDKLAVKDIISYHQKQVTPASSAYSKVKQSIRFLRLKKTLWYRDEPNKLLNSEESEEHSSTPQECVDPVKLSAKEKLDAGHLPLSTCPSKDEICVKNESKESSASSTPPSSSGPEQMTGVCVPIDEVPMQYWDIRDPNDFDNDLPMSYWNDYSAGDVGIVSSEAEFGWGKLQHSFLAGNEYYSFGVSTTSATTAGYYSEVSSMDSSFALFPTTTEVNEVITNHGKGYSTIIANDAAATVPAIVSANYAYQGNQKFDTNRQLQSQYCSDFVTNTCEDYRPEIRQTALPRNLIKDCVNSGDCSTGGSYSSYNYPNTPIGCWNTSGVRFMSRAFEQQSTFNKNINCWDVSRVSDMQVMFDGASNFNQPLEKWNVSRVTYMNNMFRNATTFNLPIQDWNVSNVSGMSGMFQGAHNFNQPIQDWNVSRLSFMSLMFNDANNFNQPLEDWNVSSVYLMYAVFLDAYNFNQCLGSW